MDPLDEIRAVLKDIVVIQDQQAKMLLQHYTVLAEHDDRMERVGHHLEVLATISDDLIRKANRKKRQ